MCDAEIFIWPGKTLIKMISISIKMLINKLCDIVWSMILCMAVLFKFPSKGVDLIKKKLVNEPKRSYLIDMLWA